MPAFLKKIYAAPRNRVLLKNVSWLFFDKILRMGCGACVVFWLARYFGPEKFGIFNYAIALVALFSAMASLGLNSIVVRDLVRESSNQLEIMGSSFALKLGASLVAYLLLILTVFLLEPDDELIVYAVLILGTSMIVQSLNVITMWFESEVKSKYTVWAENSVFIAFVLVKVVFVYFEFSLIWIVSIVALECLVTSASLVFVYLKCGQSVRLWTVRLGRVGVLVKDAWPLALSASLGALLLKVDQVMLMEMLGADAVGMYGAAAKISEVWYFVPIAVAGTVFPGILKAQASSRDEYLSKLGMLYDFMVFSSVFIAIPVSYFSEEIINLIYGDAYGESSGVLAIQIWCGVFVFLRTASGQWFITNNLQVFSLYRSLTAVVINVVLNYFFIPVWGVEGAAYAVLASLFWATYGFTLLSPRMRPCFFMQTKALVFFSTFKYLTRRLF